MTNATSPRVVNRPDTPDPVYFLGRDEAEARRLIQQGRLYNVSTRWLLQQAGLQPGMRVLDVGSGSGDVALLARELVGAHGAVVGVDQNPDVLALAHARARATGHTNITFVPGDIRTVALSQDFDAVIGRFVLMYIGDPVAALVNALGHLAPGGIVAFQEMNLHLNSLLTEPRLPLWDRLWSWIHGAARQAEIETAMGYRLRHVFEAAGLAETQLQLTAAMRSGADEEVYAYFAATLRSMLPLILKTGVATADEVDIDTLSERLREATLAVDATIKLPDLVGAWAHT